MWFQTYLFIHLFNITLGFHIYYKVYKCWKINSRYLIIWIWQVFVSLFLIVTVGIIPNVKVPSCLGPSSGILSSVPLFWYCLCSVCLSPIWIKVFKFLLWILKNIKKKNIIICTSMKIWWHFGSSFCLFLFSLFFMISENLQVTTLSF